MATNDLNGSIDVNAINWIDGSNDFEASFEIPPVLSLNSADYKNHLAAGNNHTTVRYFDGHLETVGNDGNGLVSNTPTGNFEQIDAGNEFSLALGGGSITGWGIISNIPNETNFVKVAAGNDYGIALDDSGHLSPIGSNVILDQLPVHGGIVDVAAGIDFFYILMYDGTLKGYGISVPSGNYEEISAGGSHAAALRDDGVIISFGNDAYNQVSSTPSTNNFVDISCGKDFTIGLDLDGKLTVWGRDNYNQVLEYPQYDRAFFDEIEAGFEHGLAMAPDGTIENSSTINFAWGKDDYNQTSNIPEYIGESQYTYIPKVELLNVDTSPRGVESVNPMNVDISGDLQEVKGEAIKIRYEIILNGSMWKNVTYLSDAPIHIDETILYSNLIFGNNTVEFKVYSNEELETNQAGTLNIQKIDNQVTDIEFTDDLIAKETLIAAIHTNELIDYIDDEMIRRDVPASGCNSGCASLCQGCSSTCGGNCVGSCGGTCSNNCSGTCGGRCYGGCSGCSDRWF